ncbi:MAG: D-alanyl-D-alanine carboxypeptidase, partial [Clostridia bacterium]|nr:D-alanyl-D-alanine carboxypeptidase [Clostridia bacterium]
MKKTDILYLLAIMLLIYCFSGTLFQPASPVLDMEPLENPANQGENVTQAVAEPNINARAAVVMDFETGTVLYEKNPYTKRPMASTTKIMTAIIALEHASLEENVVISKQAAYMGGSTMGLKEGSTVKMKELLYG